MQKIFDYLKSYLSNNFDQYINAVCDELVNYYGNEYESEIRDRINETNFIFYVNPYSSNMIKFKKENPKNDYKIIKNAYNALKKEILLSKDNKPGILYNRFNRASVVTNSAVINNSTCYISMYDNGEARIERVIFIPVFLVDDASLIHEMIHACTSVPLYLYEGKYGKSLQTKDGLISSSHKGEEILEECITESEAQIIYSRLKEKGVSYIDRFYPSNKFNTIYNMFIPLMKKFYLKYQNEITNARITLDKEKLLAIIGKENYMEFIRLFKEYYDNCYDVSQVFFVSQMNNIVDKMGENDRILSLEKQ